MIVDVITFNGEFDLFDLRYNILKDYVDEFIVVEFDKTFSGRSKEKLFKKFYNKVWSFYVTEDQYGKYKDLALSSPNTEYGKGAEHWIREFCQKESIKDCLANLNDDDIVFIGDCDEIWNPERVMSHIKNEPKLPGNPFWKRQRKELEIRVHCLAMNVYTYYLNNRSSEEWTGTKVMSYGVIKNACLNHLRSFKAGMIQLGHTGSEAYGWHFTSLKDGLKRKLEDSYTKETYANDWVMSNLEQNIAENKDFLGRDFKYTLDESEWPQYLKDNREKYLHLLK